MREVLPFAKRMLHEHGEFFPYGGTLSADGLIAHVGASEEGNDRPKSKTLIAFLKSQFKGSALRGEIIASAVVFDVLIKSPASGDKVDAIQINLDHMSGYTAEVMFPYQFVEGTVSYSPPFAQKGAREIFPVNSEQ